MRPASLVGLPTPASTVTQHVLISKPSKTARKKAFLALQSLGEQLIGLTDEQLDGFDLDERLRDAVVSARSIKAHGALRRQKQLIGKLMRTVDPAPIQQALDALRQDDRIAGRTFHQAEQWRNRLTADGDGALSEYLEFLGHDDTAVTKSLRAFRTAGSDRSRKAARRQIFRDIYSDIERKVQKEAGSI